ncbi:hypothetical protein [Bradyrhizobium vignae]|uniref:hypothetical protein n=1 Tax=Bradyrhizobium TaxID=374 RepID=UPI0013E8EF96|nr:hypothetical protein [Bradyrhizobium vignae]
MRVSAVVRADVEIGTGAGPVCGLSIATFTAADPASRQTRPDPDAPPVRLP